MTKAVSDDAGRGAAKNATRASGHKEGWTYQDDSPVGFRISEISGVYFSLDDGKTVRRNAVERGNAETWNEEGVCSEACGRSMPNQLIYRSTTTLYNPLALCL